MLLYLYAICKNGHTFVSQSTASDDITDIIPSGVVFGELLENGIEKVHRDTFHASLGLGRYALGLTWYTFLTKKDVADVWFNDFDEEVTEQDMAIAKQCVTAIAKKYGVL